MTALNQQFFSDLAKTGQEKTLDFLHEIAAKKDFSSLKEFMVFSKEGNKNLPDLYNPDKNFGRNFFTALAAPLKQDECAGISFKKFTGEIINIKRWSLSQDQKDHIHGFLDWACHDADALLVVSRILIAKIKSFPIAREIDNAWESSDFDMPSDKLEGNFRPFLDDEQLLSLIESLSEESIKKASRKWNKNITQLLEKRKKIELKKGKLFNNFPEFKKPLIENQYSNIDLIEDFLNFTTPDQMLFIILKMENIKKIHH